MKKWIITTIFLKKKKTINGQTLAAAAWGPEFGIILPIATFAYSFVVSAIKTKKKKTKTEHFIRKKKKNVIRYHFFSTKLLENLIELFNFIFFQFWKKIS